LGVNLRTLVRDHRSSGDTSVLVARAEEASSLTAFEGTPATRGARPL
jgi:hypothetical protein